MGKYRPKGTVDKDGDLGSEHLKIYIFYLLEREHE